MAMADSCALRQSKVLPGRIEAPPRLQVIGFNLSPKPPQLTSSSDIMAAGELLEESYCGSSSPPPPPRPPTRATSPRSALQTQLLHKPPHQSQPAASSPAPAIPTSAAGTHQPTHLPSSPPSTNQKPHGGPSCVQQQAPCSQLQGASCTAAARGSTSQGDGSAALITLVSIKDRCFRDDKEGLRSTLDDDIHAHNMSRSTIFTRSHIKGRSSPGEKLEEISTRHSNNVQEIKSKKSSLFTFAAASPATSGADHRCHWYYDEHTVINNMDFLKSCHLCRRLLGQGQDLFMYSGDKAFCSMECRYQQIVIDERKERRSPLVIRSGSNYQSQDLVCNKSKLTMAH